MKNRNVDEKQTNNIIKQCVCIAFNNRVVYANNETENYFIKSFILSDQALKDHIGNKGIIKEIYPIRGS